MARRTSLLLLAVLAAFPAAATAETDTPTIPVTRVDSPLTRTLSASSAVKRDCTARPFGRRAGVATSSYRALADGQVTFKLTGGGDWDLAVFDSARTLVASSAAFRGNEVAQVGLERGSRVTVQACRRSGGDATARLRSQLARVDLAALRAAKPEKVSLVRVKTLIRWEREALERLGFDVTHNMDADSVDVLVTGAAELRKLTDLGLPLEVLDADMLATERANARRSRAWAQRVGLSSLPTGRTEYRDLADYQAELKDLAEKHAGLVKPITFKTKTFQGRDIQAIEIAAPGDDGRPVLYLNGIHHAREWPASEVIMEFAWELVKGYEAGDPRITEILQNTRVVVQPHTNIDGFIVSRMAHVADPVDGDQQGDVGYFYSTATGVVIFGGSLSYKRKNCNPLVPAPGPAAAAFPCPLAIGVDNNRNYAEKWGGPGASTSPHDQGYRGNGPHSEPETAAVAEFHSTINAPVMLSMHNVAAKVLRPPGLEADGQAPDDAALTELGALIATPAGYANEYGYQLYDVTGGTKDWSYAAMGAYGYTVETGPKDGNFHGDYPTSVVNQYVNAKGGMREGLLSAAEYTRNEAQTSRIAGRAPAGRTLRITKTFQTDSYPVCTVSSVNPLNIDIGDECIEPGEIRKHDEKIDITMTVPASGAFTWWVNPSSRPFVKDPPGDAPGKTEAYTLTCEDAGTVVETHEVVVDRGQTVTLDLPCGGTLPPPATAPASGGGTTTPEARTIEVVPTTPVTALSVKVGRTAKLRKGRAAVSLEVKGGPLSKAVITLLNRKGKKVGTAKVASLNGKRTLTIKLRKGTKRGAYKVRVAGATPAGAPFSGTAPVSLRK